MTWQAEQTSRLEPEQPHPLELRRAALKVHTNNSAGQPDPPPSRRARRPQQPRFTRAIGDYQRRVA